ncbi:hypothetical protein HPB51_021561 [Rhipicephalus microplus]|uniref:CUB domain-containing protein n=1 Tax=Rhipicephalus microplus TaxID=6941 RepID=A0A9J6DCM8_RHIMP|nr:hypothetical protein HPB51_021561 [Rhipicephalus microplus]
MASLLPLAVGLALLPFAELCGKTLTRSGRLTSPGYPMSYPPNVRCSYMLRPQAYYVVPSMYVASPLRKRRKKTHREDWCYASIWGQLLLNIVFSDVKGKRAEFSGHAPKGIHGIEA